MTSLQTFSILFWINSSRAKDNMAEIYARIVINGQRANLSLKAKVDIDKWDKNKGRLKSKDKASLQINEFITQTTQIYDQQPDRQENGTGLKGQELIYKGTSVFLNLGNFDQPHKTPLVNLLQIHSKFW